MESLELCTNCSKYINKDNMLTHVPNCKKNIKDIPEFVSYEDKKKIFNNDNVVIDEKYRKESFKSGTDFQAIKCPKCSDVIDIRDLKDHLKDCPYAPCRYCNEYYPIEFISEHVNCCEKNISKSKNTSKTKSNYTNSNLESESDNRSSFPSNRILFGINLYDLNNLDFNNNNIINNNFVNNNNGFSTFHSTTIGPDGIVREVHRQNNGPTITREYNIRNNNNNHLTHNDNTTDFIQYNSLNDLLNSFFNHRNIIRVNRQRIFNNNNNFDFDFFEEFINQLRTEEGMNKDDIEKIETITYKKPENTTEPETCTICMEEYKDGESLRKLNCNHTFHKECIDSWLVQKPVCPLCKNNLKNNN